ncbi:MAG TPA: nucleotidyltransferase family protein [Acidimicrobiales bacterium]|nr:nucleotidyltransferase family protein [Acidimicrobiales bacterium]
MGPPQLRVPVEPPGRRLDPAGRLLLRILASGPAPPAEDIRAASEALVDWAVDQRVTGLLHVGAGVELAQEAGARLTELTLADVGNHLRALLVLERLGRVLEVDEHPWVVLKGPVLAETAYAGVSRPYSDLDLLVSPARFRTALERLEHAGVELIDRNWDLLMRDGRAQVGLKDGSTGMTVDLHWHLVNLARLRHTFELPTEELLERRVMLRIRQLTAPALDRTDRVVHYALHGAISGGHRLVWLADLAQALEKDPPEWDELVCRCRRWKVGLPVAVMLARVEATLGSEVPGGVVGALAGTRAGRWLTDWLTVWEPGGRLPGRGSLRHGVTGSLAGSLAATARLTGLSGAAMVRRLWDRHPHWLDPEDPAHVEYDAGGRPGRERYLSGVATGAA